MSLIKLILDEAKADCYRCEGLGQYLNTASPKMPYPRLHCHECHGRGWTLTDIGQLLAEILSVGLNGDYAAHDHTHTVH